MKISLLRKKKGFTLIELLVVIAILATIGCIAAVAIWSRAGAGDDQVCKENLEQLGKLGILYGEDMAHTGLLPTSGMDDDPDTPNLIETHGWWIALAQLDACDAVVPDKPKGKLKLPSYFHCPLDNRVKLDGKSFTADYKTVSYVSWTDASEDPENPNSCIRTTAKQRLETLPWLTDGNPVKSQSVHDFSSFCKMVMPTIGNRHKSSINVLYASGAVKAVEATEDMTPEEVFAAVAPDMAKAGKAAPAKGKKAAADDDED